MSFLDRLFARGQEEVDEWRRRDPIGAFPKLLIEHGLTTSAVIDDLKASVDDEVAAAVKFAEESPQPDPDELFDDVLA